MRRAYSISLIAVFVLNTIGGIGILGFHHYRVHSYIRSIIRAEQYSGILTQLIISPLEADQLNWFEKGREFNYKGDMYDIVRTEASEDGVVIYHCIKDEKEKEIYRDLVSDFEQSSPAQKNARMLALELFKFLSNLLIESVQDHITHSSESHRSVFSYTEYLFPVYLSISVEPPDIR